MCTHNQTQRERSVSRALTDTSDSFPLMGRDLAIIRESMTLARHQQRRDTRAHFSPRDAYIRHKIIRYIVEARHSSQPIRYVSWYLPNPYRLSRTECEKKNDVRKGVKINYFINNFVSNFVSNFEREKLLSRLLIYTRLKIYTYI